MMRVTRRRGVPFCLILRFRIAFLREQLLAEQHGSVRTSKGGRVILGLCQVATTCMKYVWNPILQRRLVRACCSSQLDTLRRDVFVDNFAHTLSTTNNIAHTTDVVTHEFLDSELLDSDVVTHGFLCALVASAPLWLLPLLPPVCAASPLSFFPFGLSSPLLRAAFSALPLLAAALP